jgi:integrase
MPIYRRRINGRKVYWVRVNYKSLNKSRICETREAARDAEAELRTMLKKKVDEVEAVGQQPATMKALFEAYVADLEARGKGPDSVGRAAQTATAFEAVLPEFLGAPVGQLKEKDIFAFREARTRAGTKPSTVNRDLRTIRAMLKRARPDFRFPSGAFFPEDETRVRWLRPDEEITVLEPMPSPFREMAKLAGLTLMRQGEIRTLRREMVHLEQGVVLLPRAKGGARPVILSEAARKILLAQLETHDKTWVFPSPEGVPYSRIHVSRVFRKAARTAGLKDFHFHDLRHHGATMALNAGFTAPIVMQLGGWKTEKMMRRYAAVTDQTLRAAAEAVSGNGQSRQLSLQARGEAQS